MGKNHGKISDDNFKQSMTFPQGIPWNFHDQNRIGDVYVVVFKANQINRKTAHHAILIDVAESSNDQVLEGALLHLTAAMLTRVVELRVEDNPWPKDYFYEIVRIGRLVPTKLNPQRWAFELHHKVLGN